MQFLLPKFLLFQIKMDEFNCLQFLNNNNDLLAAEQLLSDDFPTSDVSFDQMVADYSPNIAAAPHGLESTGTQTKTTTTQQDEAADVSRFAAVSNKDMEELKSVAVNKNTSSSRKQWRNVFNSWCSSRHLDINRRNPVSRAISSVKSRAIHGNLLWITIRNERNSEKRTFSHIQWFQQSFRPK